jgi:transcriptional regulator with XRE-family HTH domain
MRMVDNWWQKAGRTADPREAFGRNVERLRKARGLNQATLARRLTAMGVEARQNTISRIEHGTRPVPIEEAVALAYALDLDAVEPLFADPAAGRHAVSSALASAIAAAQKKRDELQQQLELAQAELDKTERHLVGLHALLTDTDTGVFDEQQ